MARAIKTAASITNRHGYIQIKNERGDVIKEVPNDFSDPSQYTYPISLLEDAARLWMVSKATLPPAPDELIWRDRNWDNQVSNYRTMLEFYIGYSDRPEHLRDETNNWINMGNKDA